MHPDARREQILDAASEIFARDGFHTAGIASIAKRLGVGHGTFYRYFDNKRDIFEKVVHRAIGRLAGALLEEGPTAAASAQQYAEQVQRIAIRLYDLLVAEPFLARLVLVEASAHDGTADIVRAAWDQVAALTEAYLHNGVQRGFLRPDLDTHVTAQALNAIIAGAVPVILASDDPPIERDRWIAGTTRLILDGITHGS